MHIATNGIVFNEFAQVLLIQRDDTRTWAPPGGALDVGELPTDGAAREVREETGLIVAPVRMVALLAVPTRPEPMLLFSFRCIQRGGELATSPESPRLGWFRTDPLPRRMLSFHRHRVLQAFQHHGGPIHWGVEPQRWQHRLGWFLLRRVLYRWRGWRQRRRGGPPHMPSPSWQIEVQVVVADGDGGILWTPAASGEAWQLPGSVVHNGELPWHTAARCARQAAGQAVRLTDLQGVYVARERSQLALVFAARLAAARSGDAERRSTAARFYAAGEPPEMAVVRDRRRLEGASSAAGATLFGRDELRESA